MPDQTYRVTVLFTVHERSHEYLHSEIGIQEEIESALESLNATVHDVTVQPIKQEGK